VETAGGGEAPGDHGPNLVPMMTTTTKPAPRSDARRLAVSLVGLTLLGWGLGVLVLHVFGHFFHADIDRPINHWIRHHKVRPVTTLLAWVSTLGSAVVLLAVVVAAGAWLAWRRRRAALVTLVLAYGGGTVIAFVVKLAVRKGQSDVPGGLGGVTQLAFPSGHSTLAAAVYGTMAVLLFLAATGAPRRTGRRLRAAASTLVALVLTIGVARVYLGQHDPTDVLAGWLLGGLWAAAVSGRRRERPSAPCSGCWAA
jgi:membrane-associated phospholipid phosphatase